MSKLEVIQTFFQYHVSLNKKLRDSIQSVSDDQFLQDVAYSHGSLRHQVIHMANSTRMWLSSFKEEPKPERLSAINYTTCQQALQAWEQAEQELMEYIMSLNETDMTGQAKGFLGPNWQALLHLANHNTDHRAQMLRVLHDFGAPTFDQDMIFYVWDVPGRR